MNQRTTGLVAGLVTFAILTVALVATTIYFFVEAGSAMEKKKAADDAAKNRGEALTRMEGNYRALVNFMTGDAEAAAGEDTLANVKKALAAEDVANLKVELDSIRGERDQFRQDRENLAAQLKSAQAEAQTARAEAQRARDAATAAQKRVNDDIGTYQASVEKFGTDVKSTVDSITRLQNEVEERRRSEVADLQEKINQESALKASLETKVGELQQSVDQYRIKPENAASLADGRIIDVVSQDGEVFVSIGAKQRVQPGMTFDVYDSASAIQFDPGSGTLIPGKARIQVLKVDENTSTARVIPDGKRGDRTRPVVKDDVIANVIYSPDYRYRFLVHGQFDVDKDGIATAAEAEYVRGRISSWGGQVVEGDRLRGDLDFVVMGVMPGKPLDLPPDADEGQFTSYFDQKRAYDTYNALFTDAQTARVPVLNWNRMQVLTNEGR
jgi:FtsZ-binding cell division protein ZapB